MGLRQSKRSVDISGSPKKEVAAAVIEQVPQNMDAANQTIKNVQEEIKPPVIGDAKTVDPFELEKSMQDDLTDKSATETMNESKVEESPSVLKDDKKEKVKKKRSFRSFSFLRREKKTRDENSKNCDVGKEVKLDATEQVDDVVPVTAAESIPVEGFVPLQAESSSEAEKPALAKEDNAVATEELQGTTCITLPIAEDKAALTSDDEAVRDEVAVSVQETTAVESVLNQPEAEESESALKEPHLASVAETALEATVENETAETIVEVETVEESEKKTKETSDNSETVQASEE